MTTYVGYGTWYALSIMLNNFSHDQLFLKTKFRGLNVNEVVELVKDDKMRSLNDVIHQKQDMMWKENFSQNVSLMMMMINFIYE